MTTKAGRSEDRRDKRWDLVVLGVFVNMCLGTVYSWSVFRGPLEDALVLTATESGLPYAVFLGVFAFSMPVAGAIMQRLGTRTTLLAGGLLVGAGWISGGLIRSHALLVVSYGVIGGAGVGLAYGVPLAVAASWFPGKRGLAMGVTLAGFGVSPFVTAPLAELLILRLGVQPAMVALGSAFALVVAATSPFFVRLETGTSAPVPLPERADAPEPEHSMGPSRMIRDRSFYGLWVSFAIGTLCGLTAIGMTASFGSRIAGLEPTAAAAAVSGFGVLNGVGRPLFGAIHDRLGVRRSIRIAFAAIAVGGAFCLLVAPGRSLLFFLGFGVLWLMLGGWLAIAPAATTRLFGPAHYVRNYGIVYTAYGVGALTGGGVSGALFARYGSHRPLFVLVIVLCVVGAALASVMIRERTADAPASGA